MSSENQIFYWENFHQIAKFSTTGFCASMVMAFSGFYVYPWF